MQTRNGSRRQTQRRSQRHKHQRRLLDLAGADNDFHDDLEANTNFTMVRRRPKSRVATAGTQHAPTILSQVKKYGIEDPGNQFVRTVDGVTDDPDNYLSRRTDLNYSYIDRANQPQKKHESRKQKLKPSVNLTRNSAALQGELQHKARGQVAYGMTIGGGELASARDGIPKPLFNMKKNSNQVQSRNQLPNTNNVTVEQVGTSEGGKSKMTQPQTEAKHRASMPLSIKSKKQKTTIEVARQIEEKAGRAGSTGFLLNEDSENSEHLPSDFERNKLPLNETIRAKDSEEHIMVQEPQVRSVERSVPQVLSQSNFEESKFKQEQKRIVSTSGPDFERIQDLVERENKRLWRLYDNRLKDGMTLEQKQAHVKGSRLQTRQQQTMAKQLGLESVQQQRSAEIQREDSEKVVTQQFLEAVKNHTVYRRDNFVSKLANQTKTSFDPYLRFQPQEKGDPFDQRPLSSAVHRAGGMYPSREAVARKNATDAVIQRQANRTFNMNRDNARPGQRPLSSNLNMMVLLKDDSKQFSTQPPAPGHYRKSLDHLGKGKSRGFVHVSESHQAPRRKTAHGAHNMKGLMSSSAIEATDEAQRREISAQHQRMLSYQMSGQNAASAAVTAGGVRQKHRPVSSMPYPGGYQNLTKKRASDKDEIEMSSDPHDFVNVRQMFDPSLADSQPKSLTGDRRTQFLMSETDMQSQSNKERQTKEMTTEVFSQKLLNNENSKEVFTHATRQTPSQMNTLNTQHGRGPKTSQELVAQLRIKSVRQSKVRIVEDKTQSGHFDIIVDLPEDIGSKTEEVKKEQGMLTQPTTTRPLLPKDKVISNATNLHRPADTGAQAPRWQPNSDPMRMSHEAFNFNDGTVGQSEFPDTQCKQLSIEVLNMYPMIQHMQDFLVFSETRSPIFIYDPPNTCSPTRITLILSRFKESVESGELEQAMSLLDLGMKQSQFLPIFKFNVGVTYLLSQQYLEAIQTFRLLSKSYPGSTAVHSNLLFAYLCDGWVNNVKEFQSTVLFQSIQAPLNYQTKSILELIKYAFTSVDLLMLDTQGTQRPKSAPKIDSGHPEADNIVKDHLDVKTSDVDELASEEDENVMEIPMTDEDLIEFVNFKWYPKIKNYERGELLVPINHLLRKKLRQTRTGVVPEAQAVKRSKSVSQIRADPFSHLPNYWNNYQKMLKVYHRKDQQKHQQVRNHFGKVLDRIHKLCNDEETFQRGITTQIVKNNNAQVATGHSSSKTRNNRHRSRSIGSNVSSAAAKEKHSGDGDVNTLLRKVKKVEEKKVKEMEIDDGQSLDAIFKQLVAQRSTYISDAVEDPIEISFFELIEGLSSFHEKYNIRTFIDEYIALQEDIRHSEELKQLIEAQGPKKNIDPSLEEQLMSKKEWNEKFVERFPVQDEQTMRARQFLLDVLFGKQEAEILQLKPLIEQMAHSHVDRKNQATMDTERFQTEQKFTHIVRMLLELQQDLVRKVRQADTEELKQALQNEQFLNQWYIQKLNKRKCLNGQPEEQRLIQTLKMSKADHAAHADLEISMQSPLNHEKLDPVPVTAEQEDFYRELYTRGWEKFTYRSLPKEERLQISKKISDDTHLMLLKARVNAQQRIIDKLSAMKKKDDELLENIAQHQDKLEELKQELKAFMLRDQPISQRSGTKQIDGQKNQQDFVASNESRNLASPNGNQENDEVRSGTLSPVSSNQGQKRSLVQNHGKRQKPKIDCDEQVFDELPKSHIEPTGLWDETAALKVIQKKIEQINETLNDPQVLFDKDNLKLKPQMDKWNNATGENHGSSGKKKNGFTSKTFEQKIESVAENDLKELSNTLHEMKSALKDTIGQEEAHLRVRPKIGHEVDDKIVDLIDRSLSTWDQISKEEQKQLDALISSKNRFFSIFDEDTRLAMYEHCKVHRYYGSDRIIVRDVEEDAYDDEDDVKDKPDDDENTLKWKREERERRIEAHEADETKRIHILLRGNIHIVQINDELDIQLRLASLRAGEVCGDQSIQRKIRDPLKVLSNERKTAVTNSEETITISISKTKFMAALFQEMQLELFYKIILLRNTSFFEELSPYSLTIIASNVEVREVKYGEIIVQQGQNPDAMYILAYGQCKTVYQYVDEKSTKVSKYANKCLKSDLPKPIYCGQINYHSLPYKQRRRQSHDEDSEANALMEQASGKKEPSGYEQPKPLSKTIQDKLTRQGKVLSKRSFPNTILGENKKEMKIMFQNHLLYKELKVGQVFGMRSLLDPLICKKHILEHRKLFCNKLDLNLDQLWEDLVKKQHESLDEPQYEQIKRKQANVKATKACAQCFEADKDQCNCLLDKLPADQREIAVREWEMRNEAVASGVDSPLVPEFNDSHLHDISLSPRNDDLNVDMDSPDSCGENLLQNPKNLSPQRHIQLDPTKAMREQKDRVRQQIEKLTQKPEDENDKVNVHKRKKEHKDRLQHKVEEQFADRLYPHLMKAQVSVIVTSATAKFLVVKKEDKSLLNEYLRVCMDRAILETNFADLDRPERNHSDVQAKEAVSRGWTSLKERQMNQFLKESKMEKKANKLLDD